MQHYRNSRIIERNAGDIRAGDIRAGDVLGDDVNVFMRFVAFVVEATGRLSSDALLLAKLACAESKNPLLLHDFVTQVGGDISRWLPKHGCITDSTCQPIW